MAVELCIPNLDPPRHLSSSRRFFSHTSVVPGPSSGPTCPSALMCGKAGARDHSCPGPLKAICALCANGWSQPRREKQPRRTSGDVGLSSRSRTPEHLSTAAHVAALACRSPCSTVEATSRDCRSTARAGGQGTGCGALSLLACATRARVAWVLKTGCLKCRGCAYVLRVSLCSAACAHVSVCARTSLSRWIHRGSLAAPAVPGGSCPPIGATWLGK